MQQFCRVRAIAAVAFGLAVATPLVGLAKEADAGAFLKALSRDASVKLGDDDLTEAQRQENFRELFRSAFDLPAISRFVLGKYWRAASEAQRQDFMAAFEELHMHRFLPLFAEYDEDAIKIESVQAEQTKPDIFKVGSKIIRAEGEPVSVAWRIRDTGESYKILDVVAEGVSMAISLRHEYGEVAKAHGIDGLIEQMRDRSAALAAE